MNQCSDDPQLMLKWVVRIHEQILIGVCGLAVDGDFGRTGLLPVDQSVKHRKLMVFLPFHSKLDGGRNVVDVGGKFVDIFLANYNESIVDVTGPEGWYMGAVSNARTSNHSMKMLDASGETGDPIAKPSLCW